jgi:hypothetical protein
MDMKEEFEKVNARMIQAIKESVESRGEAFTQEHIDAEMDMITSILFEHRKEK